MKAPGSHLWLIGCALLACAPSHARADVLPDVPDVMNRPRLLQDPFNADSKANKMVRPNLKPDNCINAPDITRELTFEEVVILSLCNNPDTRAAYLSLLSQGSSTATNYSSYLPNATATLGRSRSTSFTDTSKSTTISRTHGLDVGLTLYDFGQREFRIESAEQSLIAAGHSYNSTLQGAIASALQSYYQLLTSQYGIEVAREAQSFAEASFDAAKLRHDIGQVALSDELQAKSSLSQAKLSTEQAVNSLSRDQAGLAQLMGLSASTPMKVAALDESMLANDPFNGQVEELMAWAKTQRADLLASRAQLRSSETSYKATKRGNVASISATANMSGGGPDVNVFNHNGSRSNAIGLSVSIPIFTGFAQTYNERASRLSLDAQRESLVRIELTVEQDVWNSWHNYQTAKQSWETSKDLLASTTLFKDIALGRYKEGVGTILDVLSAQSQYTSALQSNLQTRYNLLTARVDLVRSVGVLDLGSMMPQAVMDKTNANATPAAWPTATPEPPVPEMIEGPQPILEPQPVAALLPEPQPMVQMP